MFPIWQQAEQYVSPAGAMPDWAPNSRIVPVVVDIAERVYPAQKEEDQGGG